MSIPDIDWSSDYERGYKDAMLKMIKRFEKEYNETATEDPHFAFYSRYVIGVLKEDLDLGSKE